WICAKIIVRSGPGFQFFRGKVFLRKEKTKTPPAPCGWSSRRAGSRKGSLRCSQAPNASTRAGGTAPRRGATTSSRAPAVRWPGSTASVARRLRTNSAKAGSCMAFLPDYAELHCLSNFSFLRGASSAEELVGRAAELGYLALAITDECSLAGVVRAHVAAKKFGLKLIVGSEIRLE